MDDRLASESGWVMGSHAMRDGVDPAAESRRQTELRELPQGARLSGCRMPVDLLEAVIESLIEGDQVSGDPLNNARPTASLSVFDGLRGFRFRDAESRTRRIVGDQTEQRDVRAAPEELSRQSNAREGSGDPIEDAGPRNRPQHNVDSPHPGCHLHRTGLGQEAEEEERRRSAWGKASRRFRRCSSGR